MNMSMLPHDQRIFFQIGHVIERRLWQELEQQPADMGVKKTFADVVRVFVVIHMFMVAAVFAGPHENRILKRSGATDECEQDDRQFHTERHVLNKKGITYTEHERHRAKD